MNGNAGNRLGTAAAAAVAANRIAMTSLCFVIQWKPVYAVRCCELNKHRPFHLQ